MFTIDEQEEDEEHTVLSSLNSHLLGGCSKFENSEVKLRTISVAHSSLVEGQDREGESIHKSEFIDESLLSFDASDQNDAQSEKGA
jgi:hypothetical protein